MEISPELLKGCSHTIVEIARRERRKEP